ncbi:hypothetical protein TVAG_218770 [Trichomonas vaginalis G3]|uniref:Uncharacterized protein n=1 Tax=Trichomonas vaginalis (strain ATCC PRA-98 / G3) TaxID=412133 RepID=A2G6W0_TRIV3|nr:hypothetical protein TVAG_218770 [Trichomonas vaginalis G3]|eukprot:XP_001300030.1 hypothetical protein [Trichomonas vaginalis G3]
MDNEQLEEYNAQMELIKKYINNQNSDKHLAGKVTAKILNLYCDVCNVEARKNIKHILAKYRVRPTRDGEMKRKKEYIQDFDFISSKGFELIQSIQNSGYSKKPNIYMLKSLIKAIVVDLNKNGYQITFNREAKRSKDGLYKFISDNYDLIKSYIDKGTKFAV